MQRAQLGGSLLPPTRRSPAPVRTGHKLQRLAQGTKVRVQLVGASVGAFWGIELLDALFFGGHLDQFGVRPRSIPGLWGIPFAPLLHGGFAHLVANTVPWVFLGFLTTARKVDDFWRVALVSTLTAGLGAWLLGASNTVHVGASGVVFGFLGFLMGRGFWERKWPSILLSVVVTVAFGSMLGGMVPVVAGVGISWQAHLFGWLGGLWVARSVFRGGKSR
jgi:membrane associated rhomboid family serine protease